MNARLTSALVIASLLAAAFAPLPARADEVCNVKIVTDANPDYSDVGSLIYSATSQWPDTKDKCWAMYRWNHIARRQTQPVVLHGLELTDPIMQFNDYGYAMCSTVSGINCSIWGAMGLSPKLWDITLHTVAEVEYDGRYHMYDNSMSAIYTLCDGKTLASVPEIGAAGACEKSGGKKEPGHIAKYHCLNATSPNGFLTGADDMRALAEEFRCFNPSGLKYRYYFNTWDLGHRYILNLRDNEVYTRYYHRLDAPKDDTSTRVEGAGKFSSDRAYYVPNPPGPGGKDPEAVAPRYRIRGNGIRIYSPSLAAADLAESAYSMTDIVPASPSGVMPAKADAPSEIVFRVEGSNVITSMSVKADFTRATDHDVNAILMSTDSGIQWSTVWVNPKTGSAPADIKLVDPVNGSYDVLVKVKLYGKLSASDAQLRSIRFETVTQLNTKTQPSLLLGKNTVYVGAGDQTESIVLWPELQGDRYEDMVVEEHNVASEKEHPTYAGVLHPVKTGEDAWVVYRVTAPQDITRLTFGGRFYNRAPKSHVDLLYSIDDGATWVKSWTLTDTSTPWDVIHYEKAAIPAGHRAVLVKYLMNSGDVNETGAGCSIFALRIMADYKPADAKWKPMVVTFNWSERQEDYSLVERSHIQLVEKVPFTYTINVGGTDHPVVNSLSLQFAPARADIKVGYSDGKDVGGEKYVGRWETLGTNLALGKPCTSSLPSETGWGAGDPDGKILTDGVVGPTYVGGNSYKSGALWTKPAEPIVTVDLGKSETCGAFRIQVGGYPWWDATKGEVKDKVELLTSADGKEFTSRGVFNFNLRWKDLPLNYLWPQDEANRGHNFALVLDKPVDARYVQFKLTPARIMSVSELQVYDAINYAPFDMRVALPDGQDRSDITAYLPRHVPSQPYKPAGK